MSRLWILQVDQAVSRIKAFYGTSENAVKTKIWIAVPVYVQVAIEWLHLPSHFSRILCREGTRSNCKKTVRPTFIHYCFVVADSSVGGHSRIVPF
jgi:hypothetical protein